MTHLSNTYSHPITKDISYDFVRIPAGEFLMGSEEEEAFSNERPIHGVKITNDFYLGIFPVTQAVWTAVMDGHNPSHFKGKSKPVDSVSWYDIVGGDEDGEVPVSFISKLSKNFPVSNSNFSNWQFRLPTEAEWEYAAKGNTIFRYSGGDHLKKVAWHYLNNHSETKAVGMKLPNNFGLYDMSGNIYEWCLDLYDENYYRDCKVGGIIEDPFNYEIGEDRIFRGGTWLYGEKRARVSYRSRSAPHYRGNIIGFRLALAPGLAE